MGPNKLQEEEALAGSCSSSSSRGDSTTSSSGSSLDAAGDAVVAKEKVEEAVPVSLQNLESSPRVMGLLYSLLPTPSLLSLRCCSKVRENMGKYRVGNEATPSPMHAPEHNVFCWSQSGFLKVSLSLLN